MAIFKLTNIINDFIVKTGNYTAKPYERIIVNASGDVIIYLPENPDNLDEVEVIRHNPASTIYIYGNGYKIHNSISVIMKTTELRKYSFIFLKIFNYWVPLEILGDNFFDYNQIASGDFYILVKKQTNFVWSLGLNTHGQLGDNTRTDRTSPVSVLGGISFRNIACCIGHSIGINGSDGSAWAWGLNSSGQLGTGDTTSYSSPVSVHGGISFTKISCGNDHSAGIRGSDGSAWTWGNNSYGKLGVGDTWVNRSSPVSVLGGISFSDISCGYNCIIGISGNDGSCWAWGYNLYGQLGDNTKTDRTSPVSVVGGISFKNISCCYHHSIGVRGSDGSAWAWGWNLAGELGDGARTMRVSPISVLGGISFTKISCGESFTIGINGDDNSAWAWGLNSSGQLGTGDTTSYSSPVSVLGGIDFIDISCGKNFNICVRKVDGSVWGWGLNGYSQLGTGDTTSYSSPVLSTYLSI